MPIARKYDYANFVKQWTLSTTHEEVASKTGMPIQAVVALGQRLTRQGVRLKKFRKRDSVVATLNKIIEEVE